MVCELRIQKLPNGHEYEIEWGNWLNASKLVLDFVSLSMTATDVTQEFQKLAHGHWVPKRVTDYMPRNSISVGAIANIESGRPWPSQILQSTVSSAALLSVDK